MKQTRIKLLNFSSSTNLLLLLQLTASFNLLRMYFTTYAICQYSGRRLMVISRDPVKSHPNNQLVTLCEWYLLGDSGINGIFSSA